MSELIININSIPKGKKVIVFDIDGTLADSKQSLDDEMASLLSKLLAEHTVAVIGGASFQQMEKQVIKRIDSPDFNKFFVLTGNGGALWRYENGKWSEKYNKDISEDKKREIFDAIEKAKREIGFSEPENIYGIQTEDRVSQITFSALGQEAPLDEKTKWSREHAAEHKALANKIAEYLPDMEVKDTGLTSVDITQKGIDKKFGIEQLVSFLGVSKEGVLFVGDNFAPDGNDTPALGAGVSCFKVSSIEETKDLIRSLI